MNVLYILGGIIVWGVIIGLTFLFVLPKGRIYDKTIKEWDKKSTYTTYIIAAVLIAVCVIPMGMNPMWNGEIVEHRDQYEKMAEAILNGHLYLDCEVDPNLLAMDNPYDPAARDELGVTYQWDHAFYNGHYYMYFGVVPVFLLFLPFRIITGCALTTYHATQIFVALFIIGMFRLFYAFARKFFDELPQALYWIMCVAFCSISVWFSIGSPALYCTAITSGLCLEIWSIYFFFKAVWENYTLNRKIMFAFVGALLGAGAFGCRPTVALANILVIPMLVVFIKEHKMSAKLFGKLCIAASPYLVIGALLMIYNMVRFDSPFEFGQAYQLTVADQTAYSDVKITDDLAKAVNVVLHNMFDIGEFTNDFPWVTTGGALINFSILFVPFAILFNSRIRAMLKENRLVGLVGFMLVVPVIVSIMEGLWSPFLLERYHLDIYWIMSILSFLVLGYIYKDNMESKVMTRVIAMWGFLMFIKCILFCLYPSEANYVSVYPEALENIKSIVSFGIK